MEIVATTIRVHEYTVRKKALVSPKHCSAENKHRAAFCCYGELFKWQKTHTEKIQHFLSFLVSSALQTMHLYRWILQLGHPFYLRGHFSTFGFRCERCAVHYISVTLSFQGQTAGGEFKSIRAWLPVTLKIARRHLHTQDSSGTYSNRQSQILYIHNTVCILTAVPSCLDFKPTAVCKQLR